MGGFVLENFFIKKGGGPKFAYLSIWFWKMLQYFLEKQNHRGASAQIFFTLLVEKPLKNVGKPPNGWFCLRKIFYKKRRQAQICLSFDLILKNGTRFLGKTKSPRSVCSNFFTLLVEKPLKNVGKPPNGWFCLRKFFYKKRRRAQICLSFDLILKNATIFLGKTKSPRSVCANFFYPPRWKTFEKCRKTTQWVVLS